MLFLMDTSSGLQFWSGAILRPIDVLYIAPVVPSAIHHAASPSFAALHRQTQHERVVDNYTSREVIQRYFPSKEFYSLEEVRTNPNENNDDDLVSLSNPLMEWRVLSNTHLDPFPPCDEALLAKLENNENHTLTVAPGSYDAKRLLLQNEKTVNEWKKGKNHTTDCPSPAARYIIETERYTLRDHLKTALQESKAIATRELSDRKEKDSIFGVMDKKTKKIILTIIIR
ncbi:hypothetical protein ADEAN_000921800 [Angomonas deanei]|uniref:Uncharacterized protein n=1 Tax=Angomonas deanei TaxID=59799 RepID=A0A7G2CPA9_9TRYP|nr:hypothetical protein ADEAN_000921800 [Angomonas deanei]